MRLYILLLSVIFLFLPLKAKSLGSNFDTPSYSESHNTNSGPTRTETFRVDGPVDLEVTTRGGWIEVQRGPSEEVKVEMFVDRSFSFFGRDQSLDQHRIVIQQRNNAIKALADPRGQSGPVVSFRVTVPEETSAKLKSSGGSIKANGVSGKHSLESSGGSIDVQYTKGTTQIKVFGGSVKAKHIDGALHVETFGGSVNSNFINGEARIRSHGGSINVLNLEGGLLIENMGGTVTSHISKLGEGVRVSTSGGSIDFIINQNDLFDLVAQASQVMVYHGMKHAELLNLINQENVRREKLSELSSDSDRRAGSFNLSNGEVPVILENEAGIVNIFMYQEE